VWLRRCPHMDSSAYGKLSFGYWLAVDDRLGCAFEPSYSGNIEDLVPEGFDDFELFIGGDDVVDFPSDAGEPPAGAAPPAAAAPITAEDGTELRFAVRLDSPQSAREWLSRPDAYVRCDECGSGDETVPAGDPERECDCGAFARNEEGELEWDESHQFTFPTVYLAE
jgi:hypothetical protein